MSTWIRRILMAVSLLVFVFAAATVAAVKYSYSVDRRLYAATAETFTEAVPREELQRREEEKRLCAPIAVDLAGLREQNPDIVGWIWCEDTVINYPVLQSDDNDRYLRRTYDGKYSASGSIFVEALNHMGFADYNTVVYGHNMRSNDMFAGLKYWQDPDYAAAHPVMYLLTEQGDWRIDLLSAYTTSAYSETYTIYLAPGTELDDYIARARSLSAVDFGVEPQPNAKYVLLSTCAYLFDDARYVVHGMLTPCDSVCGRLAE